MARNDEERSSHLLAREQDAEKRWKARLTARLQHERKVEARQEKDQIRRSIILGRLLMADLSPEARALLDGYIGGLKHAQDLKLFAPAALDPRAILPSLADSDIEPDVHDSEAHPGHDDVAADGQGMASMPDSSSLLIVAAVNDRNDSDALLRADSDGAFDPGQDEPPMEHGDDASPPDLKADRDASVMDQAVEVEPDNGDARDDTAARDVDDRPLLHADGPSPDEHTDPCHGIDEAGHPVAEHDAVPIIDLHGADAETAPSDDDRMDVETAKPSPDVAQEDGTVFVPLVYDTPQNTRTPVEALDLGIRRQPLNDGSYRWGAFATTPAQSRALRGLGLKLIGPANTASLSGSPTSDHNVRRRIILGAEPRPTAHQVPPLISPGEPSMPNK